jgi:mRNA interferase MazF
LINFPFSDLSASKVRPALVISNDEHNRRDVDRVFVLISSNTSRRSRADLLISEDDPDFPPSGLRVPSVFRCGKLLHLDSTKVRAKRMGHVGPTWIRRIADAISELVHPS